MNLNKARDFYSAYHEGTLDEGLKQAFERALATDAEVAAEYRQFQAIMAQLGEEADPVVVPADLHLKIRDRVDAHINAAEKKHAGSWFFAWKPIAYGAVATAAMITAIVSISNRSGSETATAGLAGVEHNEAPRVVVKDGAVRLQFATIRQNTVTVNEVATGRQLLSKNLVKQRLDSPLTNLSERAMLVSVSFSGDYRPILIAIPGTQLHIADRGAGTVADLVTAVAGMYGSAVVLDSAQHTGTIDWDLDSPDVLVAMSDELKSLGLKAEVRPGGLVWISSN